MHVDKESPNPRVFLPKRLRSTVILLAAVAGPPLAVWSTTWIIRASSPPPPPVTRVERFGDYFAAATTSAEPTLGEGAQIWQGDPGQGAPFFVSMKLAQDAIVLLSSSRLVAVETKSGEVIGDHTIQENATLASLGATSLAVAKSPRRIWLYSWYSGKLGLHDVANLAQVENRTVERSLKSIQWVDERVFASGPFESELVRVYGADAAPKPVALDGAGTTPAPASTDRRLELATTFGRPLFPGLTPPFAKSLAMTSFDVTSTRSRLAVAYQWSDRIDVYDLATTQLERSIAGPVESKLDFGVAKSGGDPVFTLSEESRYSYVDVAATDGAILALYAGVEMRKHGTSFGLGRQIHAFTWDGRLIGIWRLSQPLQQIEIDPSTGTMYGLRRRPATSVVAIDIRQVLHAGRSLPRAIAKQF